MKKVAKRDPTETCLSLLSRHSGEAQGRDAGRTPDCGPQPLGSPFCSIWWMWLSLAALTLAGPGGCAWPTRLEVEPEERNIEPRIVRSLTEPMFEASLPVPSEGEPQPELSVSLCIWEPDLEDTVSLRIYIDYSLSRPTKHVQELEIGPQDATARDPTLRCITVRQSGICTADTTPNTVRMVDLVVASGWDVDTAPPLYRAGLTGHTDDVRIKVICE